jgi:protein SCO1/2
VKIIAALLVAVLLAVAIAAWRLAPGPPPAADPGPATTNARIYRVKGVIKEISPGRDVLRIQHEEIPGFMAAMTMPLDVKNTNEAAGLQTNDILTFNMVVTPDDAWITNLVKIGTQGAAAPEPVRVTRDVEPLNEGELLPNYRFTNQLGQAVELRQFRGQALVLAFFYTRCPYPDFCPRTSQALADTVRQLEARPNTPTNWQVLSLSFDPGFDTVPVLKAYAAQYQANPRHWSFLTGAMLDIDAITEQFGTIITRGEKDTWDHNLRTVVIGSDGKIRRIIKGNTWQPEELAAAVLQAMAVSQ